MHNAYILMMFLMTIDYGCASSSKKVLADKDLIKKAAKVTKGSRSVALRSMQIIKKYKVCFRM